MVLPLLLVKLLEAHGRAAVCGDGATAGKVLLVAPLAGGLVAREQVRDA